MEVLIGSLERKLQRPLLAKSRTLPSIPQSPTVSRAHRADLVGGSPSRGKPLFSTSHPKACTLPPAGEAWRLEDDNDEEGGEAEAGRPRAESRPRSQSPFSQLRSRAAYLRKSASVDDHLGSSEFGTAPAETKGHRTGKGKLKRKFGPFLPHIVGVGWRLQLVRNVFVPATSHRTGAELHRCHPSVPEGSGYGAEPAARRAGAPARVAALHRRASSALIVWRKSTNDTVVSFKRRDSKSFVTSSRPAVAWPHHVPQVLAVTSFPGPGLRAGLHASPLFDPTRTRTPPPP